MNPIPILASALLHHRSRLDEFNERATEDNLPMVDRILKIYCNLLDSDFFQVALHRMWILGMQGKMPRVLRGAQALDRVSMR